MVGEQREVLAEHSGEMVPVRAQGHDSVDHFVIEVVGHDGRVGTSTDHAGDFPSAAKDYNRRIVEGFDSAVAEVALRVVDEMSTGGNDVLVTLLHDDFVQLDHRPIGYPDLDKTGFVEAVVAQSDIVRVWLTQTMHAATSEGSMATGDFWTLNFDQWVPLTRGIYLNVLNGSRLARVEIFPEDQLDDAIRRFAELTTPGARR